MHKHAGTYDRKRIRELAKRVRPGDLVNYEAHIADSFRQGLRPGLRKALMTKAIGKITGPQYHTAIVGDVDKKRGRITLVETMIGRGAYVVPHSKFMRNSRNHSYYFYRPTNTTAAQGRAAAQTAIAVAGRKVNYPIKDLLHVGIRDIASAQKGERWRKLVNRLDTASANARRVSDEALGTCAQLGAHVWGKALGDENKFLKQLGVKAKKGSRIAVTPRSIVEAQKAGRLKLVGHYEPKNLETSTIRALLGLKNKS